MNEKKSLFSFDLKSLENFLVEEGFSKFNGTQLFSWIYKHFEYDSKNWTNISNKLKTFIENHLSLELPKIVWHAQSRDGTIKFLMAMKDEKTVEAVIIPAPGRKTLCLSSQVGCAIGCTFCHTGTQGLTRHLKTEEIVGQFLAATLFLKKLEGEDSSLTNIVYMGQGEPFHNFENVKKSVEIFLDDYGIGLGQRRITVSTSGLVPQIEKLSEFPPVNIAISLHSPNDTIRTELMPINKVYDLKRLFKAIRSIPLKAHRYITYEYLLIKDRNDRVQDIEDLCDLLTKKDSKINIIPFNEYPGSEYKQPSKERVFWFRDELIKRGFITTIRVTKGDDILAACGQLKSAVEKDPNLWLDT